MYFPRLYPDELLYSGLARCRVHLGISNHKTLLHMAFGDSKVAAFGLPATSEPEGRTAELAKGNVITLSAGEEAAFNLRFGYVTADEAAALAQVIEQTGGRA